MNNLDLILQHIGPDVKQHLKRCHTMHTSSFIVPGAGPPSSPNNSPKLMAISVRVPRSEGLLVRKVERFKIQHSDDDETKWRNLWSQLFPGIEQPDSARIKEGIAEPLELISHNLEEALHSRLAIFLTSYHILLNDVNLSKLSADILATVEESVNVPKR